MVGLVGYGSMVVLFFDSNIHLHFAVRSSDSACIREPSLMRWRSDMVGHPRTHPCFVNAGPPLRLSMSSPAREEVSPLCVTMKYGMLRRIF